MGSGGPTTRILCRRLVDNALSESSRYNLIVIGLDWNPVTKEQALEGDPSDGMNIYLSAKVLAEREVWKFADGHKNVDVTVRK